MFSIRTYNKISPKGLDLLDKAQFTVGADVPQPDAFILRSQKLHDEPVPESLLAVARAGAGVNNVPVEDYSRKGIVVFNTPGANANAVKELVLAAMLLGSRDILGSKQFVDGLDIADDAELSRYCEAEKKRFAGQELSGKTLGVVGLGAIGSMVADTALALGMDVIGYDPALSVDAAWRLSNQVRRMENLSQLLAASDYVTLHVPALDATRSMINHETLSSLRPGAALINFARDAIVDGTAVLKALDEKRLRLYVCDFPAVAMRGRPDVIALPHIGASTQEAEDNCAVMAANQVADYLINGNIANSVNFPPTSLGRVNNCCRVTLCNDNVSGVLGKVLSVFANHDVNVLDMVNKSRGEVAYNILDLGSAPSQAALAELAAIEHVTRVRLLPA